MFEASADRKVRGANTFNTDVSDAAKYIVRYTLERMMSAFVISALDSTDGWLVCWDSFGRDDHLTVNRLRRKKQSYAFWFPLVLVTGRECKCSPLKGV